MNKRMTGFTLVEIISVLLLTSILTGLGYWGMEMLGKQFVQWQARKNLQLEWLWFRNQLQKDMVSARQCTWNEEAQTIAVIGKADTVYYSIGSSSTRKQKGRIDSLEIAWELEAELDSSCYNSSSCSAPLIRKIILKPIAEKKGTVGPIRLEMKYDFKTRMDHGH